METHLFRDGEKKYLILAKTEFIDIVKSENIPGKLLKA